MSNGWLKSKRDSSLKNTFKIQICLHNYAGPTFRIIFGAIVSIIIIIIAKKIL